MSDGVDRVILNLIAIVALGIGYFLTLLVIIGMQRQDERRGKVYTVAMGTGLGFKAGFIGGILTAYLIVKVLGA